MTPSRPDPSDPAHRPAGRRSGARRRAAAAGLAAAAALAGAAGALAWGAPAPLRVELPERGARVGVRGLEVLVRFDAPERVEAATLRVRLNGADVTPRLLVASNGAHGVLHALLDGPNRLEVAVFARPWWSPGPLVELCERREVRFRRPADWDRG